MSLPQLLDYTLKSYFSGIKLILFFSLPLLLAFAIPIFVQTPTYIALGGIFLRTGSIPEITGPGLAIMIASFLASLFLFAFTVVNINLIIKSQRTGSFVKKEVIDGIGRYTLNVFWIFLTLELVFLIIQLITDGIPYENFIAPALTLLASIPVFYAAPALVIDDVRPWRALENSTWMVIRKLPHFILWIFLALLLITLANLVLFAIPGFEQLAPHLSLIINSIVIMPFLLVLQAQVYMTKYTIVR